MSKRNRHPALLAAILVAAHAWLPASGAELQLQATLNGANVVSATDSPGTGEARALLGDDDRIRIDLVFGGLQSAVTHVHLHVGKASENGLPVAELAVGTPPAAGRYDDIDIQLSAEQASRVRAGESYLQVRTTGYPDGAIRGQLLPQPLRLDGPVEPEEEDD
jgi:hypothetical protein